MDYLNLKDIGPLLEGYSNRVESWKDDHDEAMKCRDLEADIVMGIGVFLAIDIIDTNWHAAVFRGKVDYDPDEGKIIEGMHAEWFRSSSAIMVRIEAMEAAGYEVRWAKEFRRICRDAKAIATPDAEFFSGDALIERRDAAIDAHREGRTAELHELGD